jgi:hypothetical protein
LVGDAVRTTWLLAATVTIPLAMLNGPVNGVTLVLVVVAAMPLNVSFVNAFNAVTTVLFGQQLPMDRSLHRWIVYYNAVTAVSQFAGLTFNPVDGLASHNGR